MGSRQDHGRPVDCAHCTPLYPVVYYGGVLIKRLACRRFSPDAPNVFMYSMRDIAMQAPPYKLATVPSPDGRSNYHPLADLCCAQSDKVTQAQIEVPREVPRRARLIDLDPVFHCSVIGTCLSTGELRKLVPRLTGMDRERASDLDIHHAAVQLAGEGGLGAKALNKALEARFESTLKQYNSVKTDVELRDLWRLALKNGEVPAAYWAVMTHHHTTRELRQLAFGDVHMLSHLVGAANRADIRRLVALEQENSELKAKIERQQLRLSEMSHERDAQRRQFDEQISQLGKLAERQAREATVQDGDLAGEVATLRATLAARDELLARHTSRRDAAELRALQEHDAVQVLQARLDRALELIDTMQAESNAVEKTLSQSLSQSFGQLSSALEGVTASDGSMNGGSLDLLRDRRIVYVGGRPSSNATLKLLVESAGGHLTVHDGGVEDRKGLLAAALPRADMVVFPVDCIDHDSAATLKRVCTRHQVPYYPVRTASVATFVALIGRLKSNTSAGTSTHPPSRFCLRHG